MEEEHEQMIAEHEKFMNSDDSTHLQMKQAPGSFNETSGNYRKTRELIANINLEEKHMDGSLSDEK